MKKTMAVLGLVALAGVSSAQVDWTSADHSWAIESFAYSEMPFGGPASSEAGGGMGFDFGVMRDGFDLVAPGPNVPGTADLLVLDYATSLSGNVVSVGSSQNAEGGAFGGSISDQVFAVSVFNFEVGASGGRLDIDASLETAGVVSSDGSLTGYVVRDSMGMVVAAETIGFRTSQLLRDDASFDAFFAGTSFESFNTGGGGNDFARSLSVSEGVDLSEGAYSLSFLHSTLSNFNEPGLRTSTLSATLVPAPGGLVVLAGGAVFGMRRRR